MASGDTLGAFFPADNEPPSTNYATFGTRNLHPTLDFDATVSQETAVFTGLMPRCYAGGGITVYVTWCAASDTNTAHTIGWDVTFERMTDGSLDIDSDGWATAQTITAASIPATSGILKTTNVAITAGSAGTDSVAAGDTYRLRLRRDVANDDATGDAQMLSIEVQET